MKKIVLTLSLVIISSSIFITSCSKDQSYYPDNNIAQESKNFVLSKSIIEYDNYLLQNPITNDKELQPLGRWETIIDYAIADGGSAWTVFKFASKLAGPGYGAAFAFLAGVGGSVYQYVRDNYDFKPANYQKDNTLIPLSGNTKYSYKYVGELHNQYLDSLIEGNHITSYEFDSFSYQS